MSLWELQKICNKRGQTNAMKYDNLHGHKQEGDSQLQMDEGTTAQYGGSCHPDRETTDTKKSVPRPQRQKAINFAREWQQDPSANCRQTT